jgi:hypothetical protein
LGTNSADLLFQILAIVRKLADEQPQFAKEGPLISKGGPLKRLTVSAVYDWIKHSNSSLKRRSKKQLEDSIERVLDVLKRDELELDEDESLDGDFEGIVEEPKRTQIKVRYFDPLRMFNIMWVIIGWSGSRASELQSLSPTCPGTVLEPPAGSGCTDGYWA